MPGLGFLFSALGAVRKALSALWALAVKYPALAAMCLALAFSAYLWRGWNHADAHTAAQVAGRAADRAAYTEAQVEAARLALAAKAATEARYKAHAQEIQDAYETKLASVSDAARAFIDRNRVRVASVAGSSSGSASATGDRNPGVSESLPTGGLVAVSDADVLACSDATAYAIAARDWALGLEN